MRSTGLLVAVSAVALCMAACTSTTVIAPTPVRSTDDASTDDASTTTDDGSTPSTNDASPDSGSTVQGNLPPPNLSNVCPDNNPTNTAFAMAQSIPVNSAGQARIGAGVIGGSDDWFTFVAPKHDPTLVQTNYTVSPGDTTTLTLDVYDTTDSFVANDHSSRTTNSQSLNATFEANAGASYYARVESDNSATCTPLDFYVQSLYCTDPYEDNDSTTQCAPIALTSTAFAAPTTWATSTAKFNATIDGYDEDWYSFTAPLSDPMSTSVTYTRPAADTVTLTLDIHDSTDSFVANDHSARTTASQTLNTVWEAVAGAQYRIRVLSGSQGVCADYSVAINGLWCTDNFEDNDTQATAKSITEGVAVPATVTSGDDDWYVLPAAPTNGSCSVTYTAQGATDTSTLTLDLYDMTGSFVANDHSSRNTASQTLTASWTNAGAKPHYALVRSDNLFCEPYTINCN
jgi:hypothetical protein